MHLLQYNNVDHTFLIYFFLVYAVLHTTQMFQNTYAFVPDAFDRELTFWVLFPLLQAMQRMFRIPFASPSDAGTIKRIF